MVAAPNSSGTNRILQRGGSGAEPPLGELFARHRERLRKMIRLRLDWRLRGRISSSSVLDQIYLDLGRQFGDYRPDSGQSFFLWLRDLTGRRLEQTHQQHLGDRAEEAGRELHLTRGSLPCVTAASMAAQLLGDRAANQSAARSQMLLRLQGALNGMDALDRELLAMRNFEELSNAEAAAVLGLSPAAATVRYLQALKRLNEILASIPGFFPESRT